MAGYPKNLSDPDPRNIAQAWYRTYLLREPDAGGLRHWAGEIGHDGEQTAWNNFSRSAEFVSKADAVARIQALQDQVAAGQINRLQQITAAAPILVAAAQPPTVETPPRPSRPLVDMPGGPGRDSPPRPVSLVSLGKPGAFPVTLEDTNGDGLLDDGTIAPAARRAVVRSAATGGLSPMMMLAVGAGVLAVVGVGVLATRRR